MKLIEQVTISKLEYLKLKHSSISLIMLERAGVDNWEGYDIAQDLCPQLSEELEFLEQEIEIEKNKERNND